MAQKEMLGDEMIINQKRGNDQSEV